MSYTALYRKFRPADFDDVKGQDHIVTTLRNQIKSGRIGHAYLFCGTRGTGKTTVAKILARAVNCENPKEGSPCGECAMCRAIAAGENLNVVEIDAASQTGVENVRNIIDELAYPPVEGKYKVYILDEAHMLSEGARNALLKTLEEPPSYVIFILATTEVHRIPITVMSRCQRYDFRRISIDTIAARMKVLMEAEGVTAEEKALRYVAKAADGSMRDGLSLLDRCVAFNYGHELTYEKVLDVLGAVDTEIFSELMNVIVADDVLGAMDIIERVVMQGRELSQFVTDFIQYLRNLMLLKASDDPKMEDLLNVSGDHLQILKADAAKLEMEAIFRYIGVFSELQGRMKFASQKRILFEMYLIRLMRPQMDKDDDALLMRIKRLEDMIESGALVQAVPSEGATAGQVSTVAAAVPRAGGKKVVLDKALPEDIRRICEEWNEIVNGTQDMLLKSVLKRAELTVSREDTLMLGFKDQVYADQINDENNRKLLQSILNERIGREVEFETTLYNGEVRFDEQYADIMAILKIDKINTVEE